MNHPTRRPVRLALAAVLALAAPVGLMACGSDDEEAGDETTTTAAEASAPTVTDAWARPGTTGGNSAIYMVIEGGDEDTELVGAAIEEGVAGSVELHETTTEGGSMEGDSMEGDSMESTTTMGEMSGDMSGDDMEGSGGMMNMRQVQSIPVAAGEKVELKPGGYHVMLIGLEKDLAVGDQLPVTLTFEPGGTVDVTAEVREP
jgi:copper(I)-binding protein